MRQRGGAGGKKLNKRVLRKVKTSCYSAIRECLFRYQVLLDSTTSRNASFLEEKCDPRPHFGAFGDPSRPGPGGTRRKPAGGASWKKNK